MKILLKFFVILLLIVLVGCNKSNIIEPDSLNDEALIRLIESEEAIQNFDENFDDGDATGFFVGKSFGNIYPIRVGRRVTGIQRTFSREIIGDSAKVQVTTEYNGFLIIAGKFSPFSPGDTTIRPDTIITKPFREIVKRNVTFKRISSRFDNNKAWKLQAISLPEGSTTIRNIKITKVELMLPGRVPLIITSPLDTYFFIGDPIRDLPQRKKDETVSIKVYITSNSPEEDFVTITYGKKLGNQWPKIKRKLELVSSAQVGDNWEKIYQGNWNIFVTHPFGRFHSVINAVTNETIYTIQGQVSSFTWGIPYKVN